MRASRKKFLRKSHQSTIESFSKDRLYSGHVLWVLFFMLWGVFLSGMLEKKLGAPGIWQAVELKNLLNQKKKILTHYKTAEENLSYQRQGLLEDSGVQEREIRRVLGYAAQSEIIFDFGGSE
jgi:hypothetical protein